MSPNSRAEDLAQCTLVAASREQVVQWTKARMVPWGHKQTFEQYLANGERELTEDWGKDGALQPWVLVRRDDPQGDILSGCATYRRTGMVRHRASTEVEPTYVYAIASVVTPVEHHKKGYATHMLRLLHYLLADTSLLPPFPAEWGSSPEPPDRKLVPPGIASILWSDVGSHFYRKCTIGLSIPGWIMPQGQQNQIIWKINPHSTLQEEDQRWERVSPSQLPEVGVELKEAVLRKMDADTLQQSVYASDPSSPGLLAFIPCKGAWRHPDPSINTADPCGLRLRAPDGNKENDTIIIFGAYNMTLGPRLLISYIHNLHPEDVGSLLRVLDSIGAPLGQEEGWVWGLDTVRDAGIVDAWKADSGREATFGPRSESMGHLLGVAWYGPQEEQRELVDPQMYSWC